MKDHRWYLPSLPLTVVNVTKTVSFILMIAAMANILIVKVAFDVQAIQIALSLTSVFVAVGMGLFVYKAHGHNISVFNIYVSLASAGLWFTQVAEVLTATTVGGYSKARQTGFYLAFALLSAFLYYIQRIVRESRLTSFIDGTGEVPVIDGP